MAKFRLTKPKGVRPDETVKEWYERTVGQGLGSLTGQNYPHLLTENGEFLITERVNELSLEQDN